MLYFSHKNGRSSFLISDLLHLPYRVFGMVALLPTIQLISFYAGDRVGRR